jgi:O-antigen/teichoic acid export membrane protein/Ser/Thr protein kinase RdoA (MazF antagonist)
MIDIRSYFQRAKHAFLTDSLFRNATFLMASTAIMSALGFFFWIFVAHLYDPAQIGTASALISVTTLLSSISMFGLNSGLIRFLPKSKDQSRDINAAMIVVGLASMAATAIYLVVSGYFGVHLALLSSLWQKLALIILMATVSLNSVTDAVFIANRRAEYHTAGYGILSVVKLILPLFMVPLGALGIFTAYMASVVVSLGFSFFFMRKTVQYRLFARPNWGALRAARKYTTSNYFGVLLAGLPSQLMPLIILRRIGADNVAYFSMAWMMANLLYVIPSAVTQSMLVESAHDPEKQKIHIKRTVTILAQVLVPLVFIAIIVAPYLLDIFGESYSRGGTFIFQLLAFATFLFAINSVCNTILNIQHRSTGIVISQAISVVTIGVSSILLTKYGMKGVGIAMLLGYITPAIYHLVNRSYRVDTTSPKQMGATPPDSRPSAGTVTAFINQYGFSNVHRGEDIGGGDRSSTLVLDTDQGKYVLKLYSAEKRSLADLTSEIDFTNYLSAHGVPVPAVTANSEGSAVSQATHGGATWFGVMMQFEQGQHPASFNRTLIQNMARMQATIHARGLEYAKATDNASPTQPHRKTSWSAVLRGLPRGISHFDYYQGNILTRNDEVSCVLDFEGMRYDPLIVCLLFTLDTLKPYLSSKAELREYLAAYQSIRKLSLLEKIVIKLALALRFQSFSPLYAKSIGA